MRNESRFIFAGKARIAVLTFSILRNTKLVIAVFYYFQIHFYILKAFL